MAKKFTPQEIALAKTVPKGSAGYFELIKQGYDPAIVGSEFATTEENKPRPYTPTAEEGALERVARYSVSKEEDPLSKFQREYYEGLKKTPLTVQEENTIREQARQRMQAQIDAINEVYNVMISKEREAGVGRLGETRSLTSRAGTLGSDFGFQALETTRKKNVEVEEAIQKEQALKVQAIFDKIDERAEGEIKAKQEEARGNVKAYIDYLEGVRKSAKDDIKTLAQAGFLTLDNLSEEQYKALLSQTGFEPLELEATFEASKPKELRVDFSEPKVFEGPNGEAMLIRYGFDPATGGVKTMQGSLGIQYSDYQKEGKPEIRESNGEFFMYDSETKTMKKIGGAPKPKDKTETEKKQDAVKSMASELNKVVGTDGFISPENWKTAQQAWVGEGFSSKDFKDQFGSYLNPFRAPEDYGVSR